MQAPSSRETFVEGVAGSPVLEIKIGQSEFLIVFQLLERNFDFREIFPLTMGKGVSYKPRH